MFPVLQAFSILPQADQSPGPAPSQRQAQTRPRASNPAFELGLPAEPARVNRARPLPQTRPDAGREVSRPEREERAKPRQPVERNAERTSEPPRSAKARPRLDPPRRENPPQADAARGRRFLDKAEAQPTEPAADTPEMVQDPLQTAQMPVEKAEEATEQASINAAFLAALVEESDAAEPVDEEMVPSDALAIAASGQVHLEHEAADGAALLQTAIEEPQQEAAKPADPTAMAAGASIGQASTPVLQDAGVKPDQGKAHAGFSGPITAQGTAQAAPPSQTDQKRGDNGVSKDKAALASLAKPAQETTKTAAQVKEAATSFEAHLPQAPVSELARPAASMPMPEHISAAQRASHPVPVAAVSIEIGLRAMEGLKTFQIRLSPEDLGVIDVSLTFKEDGKVEAAIVVDKPETLTLLQRDQRSLERAFEQAGFRADEQGLSFSLRQDGERQAGRQETGRSKGRSGGVHGIEEADEAKPAPQRLYLRGLGADGRLDIQI
jgi:flagellar hook-length control protein FliK